MHIDNVFVYQRLSSTQPTSHCLVSDTSPNSLFLPSKVCPETINSLMVRIFRHPRHLDRRMPTVPAAINLITSILIPVMTCLLLDDKVMVNVLLLVSQYRRPVILCGTILASLRRSIRSLSWCTSYLSTSKTTSICSKRFVLHVTGIPCEHHFFAYRNEVSRVNFVLWALKLHCSHILASQSKWCTKPG